jgi:hypothetical protein
MRILILIAIFIFSSMIFSTPMYAQNSALPPKVEKKDSVQPDIQSQVQEQVQAKPKVQTPKRTGNISALSTQVNAMKTEVLSEKMQVVVLKDLLKKEGLDGSRKSLIIAFKNDLGKRYLVDSLTYKLNEEIIYQYVAEDRVVANSEKNTPVKEFEAKIVPGPYNLEVQVIYRGNDSGVFSYVKDYRITREEKMSIDVKKASQITVNAFESGGVFADFKDRPQLTISQN